MQIINIITTNRGIIQNVTSIIIPIQNDDKRGIAIQSANQKFKDMVLTIDNKLNDGELNEFLDDCYYYNLDGDTVDLYWSNDVI
jgi:hypothetical protein